MAHVMLRRVAYSARKHLLILRVYNVELRV